jgi:SulP family sulfate permease
MGPGSTPVIGDIPTGFPEFIVPVIDMELLFQMVTSAITLAGLGAIDSLLTSLVADNITRSQHRSDRELIGQGIGNMIAGLFGGLPGAGATMRTVVNVNAGGRTPISGALHAVILLAMVLGAGALAQDIPKAVLAGILIKVGTDIIDWDYLKRLRHAPIPATVIMTTVFVITVAIDLLLAVGVGMVMASFYFMHRITQVQIANMRPVRGGSGELAQNPEEKAIMEEAGEQILLFHLSGPMSFSSAKAMVRMHAGIQDYQVMLLDLTEVPMVDFTSSKALEDIIIDTLSEGNQIYLVGVQQEVHRLLSKLGVIARLPDDRIYPLRIDALRDAMKFIRQSDG